MKDLFSFLAGDVMKYLTGTSRTYRQQFELFDRSIYREDPIAQVTSNFYFAYANLFITKKFLMPSPPQLNAQVRQQYQDMFTNCKITRYPAVNNQLNSIVAGKAQYDALAAATGVPWYVTGLMHSIECNCDFDKHLHNGDPLNARTVHVPKNLPQVWNPPNDWQSSANDALREDDFLTWQDWGIAGTLYKLEAYNGWGYRWYHPEIANPYMWSFSAYYTKGKYASDGHFDPDLVSNQCGLAVLLRRMAEINLVSFGSVDSLTAIKNLGIQVTFNANTSSAPAKQLQLLLNNAGEALRIDGVAGRNTSDAYHDITGEYLQGDPDQV